MPEFPQFLYRRVNGSLVCKKVFDVDSAEQLRRQGFKLSAELWPAVATVEMEPPLIREPRGKNESQRDNATF